MSQDDLTDHFAPRALLPASAPQRIGYAPAPIPAPPPTEQAILTRGVVQETPAQKARAYAGLGAALLGLTLLTYAVAAIPVPIIPAPAAFVPYTSTDAGITCAAPEGWKQREDMMGIAFTQGKARIEIEAPPTDLDAAAPSLGDLHTQEQTDLSGMMPDAHYQEHGTWTLRTGMAGAMLTDWTAAPDLSHLHGYRATLTSGNMALSVICICPQRDWANLQPAFLRVIESIAPVNADSSASGQGGG